MPPDAPRNLYFKEAQVTAPPLPPLQSCVKPCHYFAAKRPEKRLTSNNIHESIVIETIIAGWKPQTPLLSIARLPLAIPTQTFSSGN